jgi:hypothetical protein
MIPSDAMLSETAIQVAWEGSPQAWARKAANQNEWRVSPSLDAEDLYQEAWILWYKVCEKYPDASPPNRMSLFMISVQRRFHSLASYRTRKLPRGCALVGGDVDQVMDAEFSGFEIVDSSDSAEFWPDFISRLVSAFSADRHPCFLRRGSVRETTPEYLRRLSGVSGDVDVMDALEQWRVSFFV